MKFFRLHKLSLFLCIFIFPVCLNSQTAKQLGDKAQDFSTQFLLDSALHYYQLAADQYLIEGDTNFHYRFRLNVAFELLRLNKLDEALTKSRLAVEEGADKMDDINLSAGYRMIAQALNLKKDTQGALNNYQTAIEILKDNNSEPALRVKAVISSDKGILYYYKGDYAEAENHWRNALITISKTKHGKYAQIFCEFSLNLSAVLLIRGAKNQSIEVLEKAAFVADNYMENPENMLAHIYGNLGMAYDEENSRKKAIEYYIASANVLDKVKNEPNKALNLYSLSSAYLYTGQSKKALELVMEGISISEKIMGKTHENTLIGYNTLADYYEVTGDYQLAERLLYRILDIEKNQVQKRTSRSAIAYHDLAQIKEINSDIPSAISYCRKAIEVGLVPGDQSSYIGRYGNYLGELFLKTDQIDSALYHFQSSLKSLTNLDLDMDPLVNPQGGIYSNLVEVWNILINKARALERKFDLTRQPKYIAAAIATISKANTLTYQIKQQSNIIEDKFSTQSNLADINKIGFRLAYKSNQLSEQPGQFNSAFQYMQANKSNLILNHIQENISLESSGLPIGLIKEHDDVQSAITYYEERLFNAKQEEDSTALIAKYNNLIFSKRTRQDSLRKQIERGYPNFYSTKFKTDFVDISDIQKQLSPGQLMLNYHIGDSSFYIFQISKDKANLFKKPLNSINESDVKQLLALLERPQSNLAALQKFAQLSGKIKAALIPDPEQLKNFKQLIILPDKFISVVPFEILASNSGALNSFSDLDYLIRNHSIAYANSATLLARQNTSGTRTRQSILAFAPSFNKTELSSNVLLDSSRSGLKALVWTEKEVQNIAKHFETNVQLGSEATERKFRDSNENYSIIHVASHGLLNEEEPLYSKLVFSPFDTDSINDGYLNTQELFTMKIPAEMIVLSACNSGSGDLINGEGVISLANGFFYAGSKSLVMSLWTANDQSTATIIDSFYEELSQGKPKSEALRNAKLKFLNEADGLRSHPYYWAHMVVNGNDNPIVKNNMLWIYLTSALVLIVLVAVIRRARQRQTAPN